MSFVAGVKNAQVKIENFCFHVPCFSQKNFPGFLIPAWARSWVFCLVGKEFLKICGKGIERWKGLLPNRVEMNLEMGKLTKEVENL